MFGKPMPKKGKKNSKDKRSKRRDMERAMVIGAIAGQMMKR